MSYLINAWLEHGEPRLGIVSAYTGEINHLWRLSKITNMGGIPQRRKVSQIKHPGTQQLLRELFLIGCVEEINLVRRINAGDMGNTCLYCDSCSKQAATGNVLELIQDIDIVNGGSK